MAGGPDLLVVDDEPVILRAASKILQAEGLRTEAVADGEAALEKIASRRYRAVLCDLVLPGIGGFELVEKLRERTPDTPIILITGYATVDNATEGFTRGIFDFIPKPFDDGELLGVVERALEFAGAAGTRERTREPAGDGLEILRLGGHAWVALQSDRSARVGLGETFAAPAGDFESVELPEVGALLLQGNWCARWTTRSRRVHRLWTPLSGRVIETNGEPLADPSKRSPATPRQSWVVRLMPSNLEPELSKLARS